MTRAISVFVALGTVIGLCGWPCSSSAFHPCRHRCRSISLSSSSRNVVASLTNNDPSKATALQMSSIPDGNDNDDIFSQYVRLGSPDLKEHIKNSLPPTPEDLIALSGDMLALFVYSYLDHTANEIYAETTSKMEVADLVSCTANNPDCTASLPVWFDTTHLQTFGQNWLNIVSVQPPYAPAIAVPGLAFVSIATSWLACGYISGAFLHHNTVECTTENAMLVTLRTWICTAAVMVLLAWGSDAVWGALDVNFNALSAPARGGLTKADADFIFDSLTVLALWRYAFNWFLGYRR